MLDMAVPVNALDATTTSSMANMAGCNSNVLNGDAPGTTVNSS